MTRAASLLLALAACGGGGSAAPAPKTPAPPNDPPVPAVRLAAAHGATLRLLHTARTGLVVDRTITLPAKVSDIVWAGDQVAVWLDRASYPPLPDSPGNGPHSDEMGRITATGYEPFAAIAWPPSTQPHDDQSMHFDTPQRLLYAHGNELWQGYCEWGGYMDGGFCAEWTYARAFPAPVVFSTQMQADSSGYFVATSVAPARDVAVKIDPPADASSATLTCTRGGHTTQYPPAGDADQVRPDSIEDVTWLAASPPVFLATAVYGGFVPHPVPVIFEGCDVSPRFGLVAPGPQGMVALSGDQLAVWWRGKMLGAPVDGADVVVFAP